MLSSAVTQQHQNGQNSTQKRNLLVHIDMKTGDKSRATFVAQQMLCDKSRMCVLAIRIELSTAVVEVDIKVTNVNLTRNQCLQCVTPPLTHVEISRPHDATELNNDGMIKMGDVHYKTDPDLSIFTKEI